MFILVFLKKKTLNSKKHSSKNHFLVKLCFRKRRSSKLAEKEEVEGSSESSSKRRGSIASGINEKRQEDPIVSPVPLSVVVPFSFANKL